MITPASATGIVATITLFNAGGDPERSFAWKPARPDGSGRVDRVNTPAHKRMIQDILTYFGLKGEPQLLPVIKKQGAEPELPKEVTTGTVIRYTPGIKTYADPTDVWTIDLKQYDEKSPVWAYSPDDGEFAAQVRQERTDKVAVATETKRARKATAEGKPAPAPKAEKQEPKQITLRDLPLNSKPKTIEIPGYGVFPVKVLGKTIRDMKNPDGGSARIEDPNTKRTAMDDVNTYSATAYQLGKVKEVLFHKKGVLLLGAEGVTILQTIRKNDTEEVGALIESATKRGSFKGVGKDITD